MRTTLFALATAAAAFAVPVSPAAADQMNRYQWCAEEGEAGTSCSYVTYEQCAAAVLGIGGYCERNPMYVPGAQTATDRHSRRRITRQAGSS